MTADLNRFINIQYCPGNNLPFSIIHPQGRIVNHYTLGGAKLGKMLFDRYGNLTWHEQYFGDLVIKDGQPTRILHGDGTISLNGSSVEYHYHLKDHLGNVRLVITPNGNNQPVVLQTNDYYPFGMASTKNFESGGGAHQPNKYLYNNKEEQEMPGKWLDYGWRMYDPQLVRFHSVDPHSENYLSVSSYAYVGNNPIIRIDPDGRDWYEDKEGNVMWRKGSKEIEGYSNMGESYTYNGNGFSIAYNQNQAVEMTENVLQPGDWTSQRKADGTGNKDGDEGNCFYQSGAMVSASGTQSLLGDHNDINNMEEGLSYLNTQINQGYSARVHVDRDGDNSGDHWIAISSRTTDLKSNSTKSFGFYDPGTRIKSSGTHSSNSLKVGTESVSGTTRYSGKTYKIIAVRENEKP